jgi:hypothetical protein
MITQPAPGVIATRPAKVPVQNPIGLHFRFSFLFSSKQKANPPLHAAKFVARNADEALELALSSEPALKPNLK